jgi:hypothetical protein
MPSALCRLPHVSQIVVVSAHLPQDYVGCTTLAGLLPVAQPAFLTGVCHCFAEAVQLQQVALGTACSKQWHTGGGLPCAVRNAG